MEMTIRPITKTERMYCYTQSQQIRSQTGNIGYLRADMDTDGTGFFAIQETQDLLGNLNDASRWAMAANDRIILMDEDGQEIPMPKGLRRLR